MLSCSFDTICDTPGACFVQPSTSRVKFGCPIVIHSKSLFSIYIVQWQLVTLTLSLFDFSPSVQIVQTCIESATVPTVIIFSTSYTYINF